VAPLGRLELTDCTGWFATVLPLPRSLAPGQPPPGWEVPPGDTETAAVILGGFDCARLSLGRFERPVRIVYDAHGHLAAPRPCFGTASPPPTVLGLNSLWVSDPEVAAELRSYGMPAYATNITEAVAADAGAARLRTWAWGDPLAPSTLTFSEGGALRATTRSLRLVWLHGEGLGMLELEQSHTSPSPTTGWPAHGSAQPPMLLSTLPEGRFAGQALWHPTLAATGQVTLYKDLLCAQPEA
jgi:hypothetical protein